MKEIASTARALGFQSCARSARRAATPPAPTPATSPVTPSPASAEAGMPTSSASPMARRAAPGARGCSDTNASRMNTNGSTASPKAISATGPRAGATAVATRPLTMNQYAGTSRSVARTMARHRFRGGSGAVPLAPRRAGASALDRTGGEPPDEVALQGEEHQQRKGHRDKGRGREEVPVLAAGPHQVRQGDRQHPALAGTTEEDVGDQQVVPHPQELEDGEGGQRGNRERHDQPPEDREVVGAVDLRRLDQRGGEGSDVVAEEVDRQRQPERGVGQPDPQERSVEVQVREDDEPADLPPFHVEAEDRDECHLEWHHQQPDDQDEEHVAASELHPGERVRRERGHGDRDHRGGDGHGEAVQSGVAEPLGIQGQLVVVQGPGAIAEGFDQGRPPPGAVGQLLWSERRDHDAERGDQPQDHDQQDRYPHQPAAAAAIPLHEPAARLRDGGGRYRWRAAHLVASCSRNLRTFQIMMGTIATKRTTAMAAPRPSWLRMKNHRIMRSAITSVPWVSALPMTNTMSKTFSALMTM